MKGKRELIASQFSKAGLLGLALSLRHSLARQLTILAYHRVIEAWDEETFGFDPGLISASSREFEWQMRFIKRHFSPISFESLISSIRDGDKLPDRPIIVTFDDGYDDNFRCAFPILRDLQIPATIFLATQYIGGNTPFWYDWLYHLCYHAHKETRPVRFGGRTFLFDASFPAFLDGFDDLILFAKHMQDSVLRQALQMLESELAIHVPDGGFANCRALSWDQVRSMSECNIEFGSHSVSHPVLSRIPKDKLTFELSASKMEIEKQIGKAVNVIAYPVGELFAFDECVNSAVKEAGYTLGVTYQEGANILRNLKRFELKRIRVERYTSRARFQMSLVLPGW